MVIIITTNRAHRRPREFRRFAWPCTDGTKHHCTNELLHGSETKRALAYAMTLNRDDDDDDDRVCCCSAWCSPSALRSACNIFGGGPNRERQRHGSVAASFAENTRVCFGLSARTCVESGWCARVRVFIRCTRRACMRMCKNRSNSVRRRAIMLVSIWWCLREPASRTQFPMTDEVMPQGTRPEPPGDDDTIAIAVGKQK